VYNENKEEKIKKTNIEKYSVEGNTFKESWFSYVKRSYTAF
jgi:hypothetical protein